MSISSGSACEDGVGCGGGSRKGNISVVLGCERSVENNKPRWIPPPRPVILFNLAEPPARILASRRSFRILAWSAALDGGVVVPEDGAGGVSAILGILRPGISLCCRRNGFVRWLACSSSLLWPERLTFAGERSGTLFALGPLLNLSTSYFQDVIFPTAPAASFRSQLSLYVFLCYQGQRFIIVSL
jgi:hypothetical protein